LQTHSKSQISLDALQSRNLADGHGFLALGSDDNKTEAILNDIITESSFFDSKKSKVTRTLDAIKKELNKAPVDFYEWRLLNMRLCNLWILPLSMSPRAMLIWARFFDSDPIIENVNDEIDEVPSVVFWMYWLVSPSAMLLKIVNKFNTHTLLDETLDIIVFIQAIYEIGEFIFFCVCLVAGHWLNRFKIAANNATVDGKVLAAADTQLATKLVMNQLVREGKVFLFSLVLYYVFYYIIPIKLWDLFFVVYVYIIKPWNLIVLILNVIMSL